MTLLAIRVEFDVVVRRRQFNRAVGGGSSIVSIVTVGGDQHCDTDRTNVGNSQDEKCEVGDQVCWYSLGVRSARA